MLLMPAWQQSQFYTYKSEGEGAAELTADFTSFWPLRLAVIAYAPPICDILTFGRKEAFRKYYANMSNSKIVVVLWLQL